MELSFLRTEDAALVSIIGGAVFVLTNLARRFWPALDGHRVLFVVFGLATFLTIGYLLYIDVAWSGVTIGRVMLVSVLSAAMSIIGAETYKSQLVNRARGKAAL
jgi:hypothetical protein